MSKCLIVNAEIKLPLIHYQITRSTSESHLGLFRTTTACLTQRQLHRHDNVTTVLINYVHRKITVKSLQYGHQRDRTKRPLYRGVRIIEVGMYDFWHFWDQTNCPL